MKQIALRFVSGLGLAVLLAACGAGADSANPTQTAGLLQSTATAHPVTAVQVANNTPAPDCAADGCKSLRIIDANAEAFRYDAMRRAAAEAPQS